MSLPRYPAYKDSGVPWLGEVPAHWAVKRLKRTCAVHPSNVDKKSYEDELPVVLCNYTDVYRNDVIRAEMDFMPATAAREQVEKFSLRAGDVLITKDSETADDIAISAYVPDNLPGVVCGYHLSIVRPQQGVSGAYVKRLFDAAFAKAYFEVRANGLTRVGLSQYAIDNVECPWPPLAEQEAIAAFLDRETARVDALVAEQGRLIALLKEKRQAVISHAVTRGLNPDAPRKPSGVAWLGDVPAHWEVMRLKWLADSIQMGPFGGMLLSLDAADTGFKVFGQENTISGDFESGRRWISRDRYAELSAYHVSVGDILLTRKGSVGNARLVTHLPQPGIIDSDTIRVRVSERVVLTEFLVRVLHEASYVTEQIHMSKRGAILAGLNGETVANLVIVVPSIQEQADIIRDIQLSTTRFDGLIAEAERAIALLGERRAALIAAAVTGRVDVRGVAAGEGV